MGRMNRNEYYLNITRQVAEGSTCLRRKYGAIIVKNDETIAEGYNGAPRGEDNCCDLKVCERERLNIPKGERYELCRAVHAEQNAIICASRRDMIGSTMYITGVENDGSYADPRPCLICAKLIKNAGIEKVVGRAKDGSVIEYDVKDL
jgi:dCMP deaminase